VQPHPALPAQHAGRSRESPFCSLPHPLRSGREMPSAVNHPAPLSSPPQCFAHPSPRRLPPGLRPDAVLAPPAPGSVPAAGPGRCGGVVCCLQPQKPIHGRTCFPKPSPDPALPCPGGHCPPQGRAAGMVGAWDNPWGFRNGAPQLYLRVRSLFQAWQLMGSSRKLW